LFWSDLVDVTITEFLDKPLDDGPVGSYRVLFRMGFVVIDPDFGSVGKFHGLPPWVKGFMIWAAPKVSL